MSFDRLTNQQGRPEDHSGAKGAAASAWGRPEHGSHVGRPFGESHVGQPAGSNGGQYGNHVGRPVGDADARANAAIHQGLQSVGDIYKSSQVGSPAPDGAGSGGPGQRYPDGANGKGGLGQQFKDGGVGSIDPSSSAGSLDGAKGGAGGEPNWLAKMIGTADGKATST